MIVYLFCFRINSSFKNILIFLPTQHRKSIKENLLQFLLQNTGTKGFSLLFLKHLRLQGYTDLLERPGLQFFFCTFKDTCQMT